MKMCKLCGSKNLKDIKEYQKKQGDEKYICKKCGKKADEKSNLCSGKLNDLKEECPCITCKEDKELKKLFKKKVKNLTLEEFVEGFKELMKEN